MGDSEPIKIREVAKLVQLGVNQQFINFNFLSLESEKFVCVKEQFQGQPSNQYYIVDLTTNKVDKNSMKADAALNHPTARVVALRAGKKLQVRNLEMNSVVTEHTMADDVVFWKWISPSQLALVTADSVWHWSMQGGAAPKKVFDKLAEMASSQIINYRGDGEEKWFCLVGLSREADGTMKGHLQLYSAEKNASQHIEGHTATFIQYKMPGTDYTANLVAIAVAKPEGGTLFIRDLNMGNNFFEKKTIPVTFQAGDFPVSMQGSNRFGVVYLLTRTGTLTLYDVHTGTMLFGKRLPDPIFITAPTSNEGFIGVNRGGQVLSVSIDEDTFVPFLMNKLGNMELAFAFASRAGLPGAEELYQRKLDQILASGNVDQAIRLVAVSPRGFLRNQSTIDRFKQLPVPPGGKPPVLQYFRSLLETDKLNAYESYELGLMALQRPNGAGYLKSLLDENKIEGSEQLGDLVRQYDPELALKLYARGNAGGKVVQSLIETRQWENVFKYVDSTDYKPDWVTVLQGLLRPDRMDAEGAEKLATMLAQRQLVDPNRVADLFVQVGLYQQVTSFLIDVLKEDKPEQSALQTRLLEITLASCPPHITEGIFANNLISHYDKQKVAQLCERKQLYARALENYEDIEDIKRVIIHATPLLEPTWLIQYFGNLDVDDCLVVFQELLKRNLRQNLQLVVAAAKQYAAHIGTEKLINLFDTFKTPEGMFHFLRGIVAISDDPEVHFRYIEAAVKVGQMSEVERMTHDSDKYDPVRTKEFLKEARLPNMWPLINVCDKHGFIQELVEYLYNNGQLKYVDAYVTQRSPHNTPKVIGTLLDVDCNEDHIVKLLDSVGPLAPIAELCDEVEQRNRLKLCLPWLEARLAEGVQETALHNALAKVYLDTNKDAQRFLETNPYYDSVVVGEYCEKRDPMLAYIAYRRGKVDDHLIRLTNKNSMYRQQAKYLVERQDLELWKKVLGEDNTHRQMVIDQVIQSALPESRDTEEVSTTVKAFMFANLPNQLIELLEKIVLHGSSDFRTNRNLQNLLILTAVNSDQARVMGYVQQLENYDGVEVAKITFEAELFEECFFVYKKHNMRKEAIGVLLNNIRDLVRAQEYADRVDDKEVYSLLGRAQLDANLIREAIASYMKADDPNDFAIVIEGVNRVQDFYADLIKFLTMCRKKQVRDNLVDTEMVYSYARLNKLAELEDFISAPNIAKLQQVGDRCFDEGMYEAAKILFLHTGNNAKLASTYLKLHDYPSAYDAAKKASNMRTWKEVAIACIDAQQFQLAHMAALNIVVSVDHMDAIINHYESKGLFNEVIHLLEVGLSMEKAHPGMFTELGVLYAKYKPEKLMEHIRLFHKKVNTSKLLRACETHHHWRELRYLYSLIDEHDNAVRVMIDHSVEAWEHSIFKEEIVQVRNLELYYRSVSFYLDEQPDMLVDLMSSLSSRIDHARIVNEVRRMGHLPLIKPYMQSVQPEDLKVVNEALNSLYIEEEDYEKLRTSVDSYGNFDQIALAQQCEKMPLLEFRRIAAYIYKKSDRFEQSIELSKKDKLYQDAMETAAESGKAELAEALLNFFVEIGQRECFAACLFTCYPLIKADVALELGWRNNILDFAFPFLIQFVREYTDKVDGIIRERAAEKEQAKKEKEEAESIIEAPAASMPVVVDPVIAQMTGMAAGFVAAPGFAGPGMLPFMTTGGYY